MAFDLLYVEDDYVDAHYFAGTYAGASLLASSGSVTVTGTVVTVTTAAADLSVAAGLTVNGTVIAPITAAADLSVAAGLSGTATVGLGVEGSANLTSTATANVTATVGLGVEGSASIATSASLGASASRRLTGNIDSDVIATSVTVAARRLTETALLLNTGTLTVTGSKIAKGNSSIDCVATNSTAGIAVARASFAIGLNTVPANIGSNYENNNIAIPNVQLEMTSALNKLYIDDYKYIIPAETREYRIPAETREYTVKE